MDETPFVVYDEAKNKDGAALPGVPLADMSKAQFEAMPDWLQRSVMACKFYTVDASYTPPQDAVIEVDDE